MTDLDATVLHGDALAHLQRLEPGSFDAMLTDPPYHLTTGKRGGSGEASVNLDTPYGRARITTGFMGQAWDGGDVAHDPEFWREALRVLKPGAFGLVFGGTRTWHRLAVALEDAGFEIRDTLMWLHGCVTPDTLALTHRGWLRHDDINPEDELCQWDAATGSLSWAKPKRIITWKYAGNVVHLKNRHADQLLTPDHNVYARIRKHSRKPMATSFERVPAGALRNSWMVDLPLAGVLDGGESVGPEYAYLAGWWLTDAWRHGDGKAAMFTQSKPATLARLRAALAPHQPSEYVKKGRKAAHNDEHTFYLTGPLADRLIAEYPNRALDWRVLGWDAPARLALVRGLIDGDGSEPDGQHGGAFWSQDAERRAVFMALCVSIGWRSHEHAARGVVYYHRERSTTQIQKRHRDAAPTVPYEGTVWCPTMPLGTWVAMRNGRPFITGNSGFPKSHDVSKAIDREAGAEREVLGTSPHWRDSKRNREKFGSMEVRGANAGLLTAPATDEAERWDGFGTALKPAWEPVILVRKPSPLTFAQTVLEHGCGALNIDAARIGTTRDVPASVSTRKTARVYGAFKAGAGADQFNRALGRWPANVVLDSEAAALLDEQTGEGKSRRGQPRFGKSGDGWGMTATGAEYNDSGGASRFYYCAKASTPERDRGTTRNTHPTVKPIDLCRWLATLLLPPARDGAPRRILVPFSGSGSEMIGAAMAGWESVLGIEAEAAYVEIARARIAAWTAQPRLFDVEQAS